MKDVPHKPSLIEFGLTQENCDMYWLLLEKADKKKKTISSVLSIVVIILGFLISIVLVYIIIKPSVVMGGNYVFEFLICLGCYSFFIVPLFVSLCSTFENAFDGYSVKELKSFIKERNLEEEISRYNSALSRYESETSSLSRYCNRYPGIDKYEFNREKYIDSKVPLLINQIQQEIDYFNSQINEKWWFDLSPKEFENEVALWFGRQGYIAKTTTYVGDGGVDVVLEKQGEKIYVQCKHYNSPVGVAVLRELFGVVKSDNVSSGILVCLVNPTKGAQDFAQNNGIRVITAKELAAKSAGIGNIDKGVIYVDANKIIGKEEPCVYVGPLGLVFNLFHYEKDAKSFAQKLARSGYYSTILYVDNLYYVIISKDSVLTKTRLFQRFGCYPSHAVVSD